MFSILETNSEIGSMDYMQDRRGFLRRFRIKTRISSLPFRRLHK